jgi:hypothetical protein
MQESRLFVPVDEGGDGECETRGVEEKNGPAEHESLSHDDGANGQIHRVADIAVEATDDQLLSRGNWCRCAQALEDEASKRLEKDDRAENDQSNAEDSDGKPFGEVRPRIPAGEQPGDDAGDNPRHQNEEKEAAGSGACSPPYQRRQRPADPSKTQVYDARRGANSSRAAHRGQ